MPRISYDDLEGRDYLPSHVAPERVRLESPRALLPTISAPGATARPWWRHPAFLLSAIMTVLAMVAMVVLMVLGGSNDDGSAVTSVSVSSDTGSVALTWTGGANGVELYAIDPSWPQPLDISQLVRGQGAWLPAASGLYTPRTCFVVRPLDPTRQVATVPGAEPVPPTPLPSVTDPTQLSAQGAAAGCVGDA